MKQIGKTSTAKFPVEYVRCKEHGVDALIVNGRRVTSMKCCGSWTTVIQFWVDEGALLEALDAHGE